LSYFRTFKGQQSLGVVAQYIVAGIEKSPTVADKEQTIQSNPSMVFESQSEHATFSMGKKVNPHCFVLVSPTG